MYNSVGLRKIARKETSCFPEDAADSSTNFTFPPRQEDVAKFDALANFSTAQSLSEKSTYINPLENSAHLLRLEQRV